MGSGGKDSGAASPSPSASTAVQTVEPSFTAPPAASSTVYVVKSGDTFTKIAKKNGVTVEELKAANPSIKDINKIAVGDEIVIPTPTPSDFVDPSPIGRLRRAARPARRPAPRPTEPRRYLGAILIAVILPASTRNVASICVVGAPGRTTRTSAS